MTERNADLLREVAEAIREHPERYDQEEYKLRTECGTVCCIWGWADMLIGGSDRFVDTVRELGLSHDEADALFSAAWLPKHALSTDTSEERAEKVAKALYELSYGASVEEVSADG